MLIIYIPLLFMPGSYENPVWDSILRSDPEDLFARVGGRKALLASIGTSKLLPHGIASTTPGEPGYCTSGPVSVPFFHKRHMSGRISESGGTR